jgi:hypothetical protein
LKAGYDRPLMALVVAVSGFSKSGRRKGGSALDYSIMH